MTDVSAGFRPPCWCPYRWAPTWRLHTNLYKFGENVSPHIFHKKNCCDPNLGGGLCISTFFLFPGSGLNLLNGFDFLFWSILNGVTLKTSNRSDGAIVSWLCCVSLPRSFEPSFSPRIGGGEHNHPTVKKTAKRTIVVMRGVPPTVIKIQEVWFWMNNTNTLIERLTGRLKMLNLMPDIPVRQN